MEQSQDKSNHLEEMLAHQEKTIEELSGQLAKQWDVIATLENKVAVLTRRLVAVEENSMPDPHVAPPPHY